MISLIAVFKQVCKAYGLSPASLSKYTSCNSCANIAFSDSSKFHNNGREALNCTVHTQDRHCPDALNKLKLFTRMSD